LAVGSAESWGHGYPADGDASDGDATHANALACHGDATASWPLGVATRNWCRNATDVNAGDAGASNADDATHVSTDAIAKAASG
jgi:hypothetical protein